MKELNLEEMINYIKHITKYTGDSSTVIGNKIKSILQNITK